MSIRKQRTFVVFGFATTHQALDAERCLKDEGLPVTPIPAPRMLGGGLCGIALRVQPADADRVRTLLGSAGLAPVAEGEMQDV